MGNRKKFSVMAVLSLALLWQGTIATADNGASELHKRNPKTDVIVDYVDGVPARGGVPGPPGDGGEDPPEADDTHLDGHYDLIGGFWVDGDGATTEVDPLLDWVVDLRGFPVGSDTAIANSFAAWEVNTKGQLVNSLIYADVTVAFGDGVNTYSMRNLGGGGVLAATFFTWDDTNDNGAIDAGEEYLEMDIVHNSTVKWAIAEDSPKGRWWDVENVGVHEVGHAYDLAHPGSAHELDKIQSMYASVRSKETQKRSPEPTGDTLGMQLLYDVP